MLPFDIASMAIYGELIINLTMAIQLLTSSETPERRILRPP